MRFSFFFFLFLFKNLTLFKHLIRDSEKIQIPCRIFFCAFVSLLVFFLRSFIKEKRRKDTNSTHQWVTTFFCIPFLLPKVNTMSSCDNLFFVSFLCGESLQEKIQITTINALIFFLYPFLYLFFPKKKYK